MQIETKIRVQIVYGERLPWWLRGKEPTIQYKRLGFDPELGSRVDSSGWEDPLEEGMATHSSILAREILWTEEPSRL